jgi:spore maturation protein CgeB
MIDLFARSRIVLGLSNDWSGQNPQIKGRDFEVPASGSLHLTASHPELGDYFEIDKEIVCYSNERELTELCNFYLEDDDERERIAEAGQERVFRDHAYTERFREIFETLGYRSISARGRA